MASRIIMRYRTRRGGIVKITENDAPEGWSPTGKYYDAWWSPNFSYSRRLDEGSAFSYRLESTIEWVKKWDPTIELVEDFDKFPMFAHDEVDGTISVSLKAEYGCNRQIEAKDVPIGSFLFNDASNFFRWHKGKDAVESHRLVK